MNIFQYDSKFNQIFMMLADMIILNVLYVLYCLPIFTIGAAQAGLFTGIRVLMDTEDDSSVAKAFFRGFGSGFKSITIVSTVYLLILASLVVVLLYTLMFMYAGGSNLSTILCIIAICIVYILHSITGPFHATFGCTTRQLFRNSFFVTMAFPLRAVVCAALVLLPLVLWLIWPHIFLGGLIVIICLYYSVAYLLIFGILKKPFQSLKEDFQTAQKAAANNKTGETETTEE